MIRNILDGVTNELLKYAADARIYVGSEKQEKLLPCYVVKPSTIQYGTGREGRRTKTYTLQVFYYPEGDITSDAVQIQDELGEILEKITVNDIVIRNAGIKSEMVEGAVMCTVDYIVYYTKTVSESQAMKSLLQKERIG